MWIPSEKTQVLKKFCSTRKNTYICSPNNGVIAQMVEQRTENPCVPGSIPGDTTEKGDFTVAFFG